MAVEIKICGITSSEEIAMLNEVHVDYAGFVIFPDSKRYVTVEQAAEYKKSLLPTIKSVAVTVNPDETLVKQIEQAGFDIIQIHKLSDKKQLSKIQIPIWQALQIHSDEELITEPPAQQVSGILLDAAEYGSGKTFSWETFPMEQLALWKDKKLILAGGLNAANVQKGIRLFSPQVVDVSSSVEGSNGKDFEKIKEFVRKVRREHE